MKSVDEFKAVQVSARNARPRKLNRWSLLLVAFIAAMAAVVGVIIVQSSGVVPGDDGSGVAVSRVPGSGSEQMDLSSLPWVALVLISTIILGFALAYAHFRSSKVTPAEEAVTEAATRELHRREKDPSFRD